MKDHLDSKGHAMVYDRSTSSFRFTSLYSIACLAVAILPSASVTSAQEATDAPPELAVLKAHEGVWDATITVWANGQDNPPIEFKGVETNRMYGDHWLSSDFVSEFGGETQRVHSIIGYDLDSKRLKGTVIDHGPYAAAMLGDYDAETKTITWVTRVKTPDGKPMVQNTTEKQVSAEKRVLVLKSEGKEKGAFSKFMQIEYTRRKTQK